MNSYLTYGLVVQSEYVLPELDAGEGAPQVIIRSGELSDVRVDSPSVRWPKARRWIKVEPGAVTLGWRDIGRFQIRGGGEILVHPNPDVQDRVLRLFILGASLGIVLLQKGLVVFHASVVAIDGEAVAFVGGKGTGKSTMAASLHARGHQFLSDDLLVFENNGAAPRARAGFPQLKLWPETLESLGRNPQDFPLLHPGLEKRSQRLEQALNPQATPLKHVVILTEGREPAIRPLLPQEALMELMPHWYGTRFGRDLLDLLGRDTHLRHCAALVNHVPISQLERPFELHALPRIAERVEGHLAGTPGTAR